jgi:hypothetical protein
MTICKTFTLFQKGGIYRKAALIAELGPSEKMATQYYDPSLNALCSFYTEDSDEWENLYADNQFKFKRRAGGSLDITVPRWEQGKRRFVFFHRTTHASGDYEYLGFADEAQRKYSGADEWLILSLQ